MEFNEKLQALRKQKGLTQDELASALFVSRTAISKWESGRGYPSIDSLKAISKFFSVTIDELLSGDELLTIAENDQQNTTQHFQLLLFGLLDCCSALLLFLPFFGNKYEGVVTEVSLFQLQTQSPWLLSFYFVIVLSLTLCGILSLLLRPLHPAPTSKILFLFSIALSCLGILLFIISLQPYPAVFLLALLAMKAFLLLKKR